MYVNLERGWINYCWRELITSLRASVDFRDGWTACICVVCSPRSPVPHSRRVVPEQREAWPFSWMICFEASDLRFKLRSQILTKLLVV